MKKEQKNSQPEASAPGNLSTQSETHQECIDQLINALVKSHLPTSSAVTTVDKCVYWILDLKDKRGMRLAEQFIEGAIFEHFIDGQLTGDACDVGFVTEYDCLREFLLKEGKSPNSPPPLGSHYLVAVTENNFAVALAGMPEFQATGDQGLKESKFMSENKKKSPATASAPGNNHDTTWELTVEAPPQIVVRWLAVRTLEKAEMLKAYEPGGTPKLTYCAWNAETNEDAIYRLDPADSTITQEAFNAERCRLHEKVNATHFACVLPINKPGKACVEGIAVVAKSNQAQTALIIQVKRDAKGRFVGFFEPERWEDEVLDSEKVIDIYFDDRAAKAAPHPSWNYKPGNN